MAFKNFEEIKAWQNARELSKLVHDLTIRANVQRDNNWIDQITRASLSIMSNIAEGNGSKSDVEFAKFLGYSKRSASEVRSLLYYAFDNKYISQEELKVLTGKANKISSQLSNLISYLYESKRKIRRS